MGIYRGGTIMKAGKFIEDYLSQCEDTVVFLHSPHSNSGTMFSIYEWHHEVIDEPNLIYDVSQITARVENFKGGLNVVINIYTEYPYEETK